MDGIVTQGLSENAANHKLVDELLDPSRPDHFQRTETQIHAGTHLILDVIGGQGLDDEALIRRTLEECVDSCGATLLHIHTHRFAPQGISGVAVLAESHISVHTWPEAGYGAFDVFMCGDARPHKAIEILHQNFQARDIRVTEFRRGAFPA